MNVFYEQYNSHVSRKALPHAVLVIINKILHVQYAYAKIQGVRLLYVIRLFVNTVCIILGGQDTVVMYNGCVSMCKDMDICKKKTDAQKM